MSLLWYRFSARAINIYKICMLQVLEDMLGSPPAFYRSVSLLFIEQLILNLEYELGILNISYTPFPRALLHLASNMARLALSFDVPRGVQNLSDAL